MRKLLCFALALTFLVPALSLAETSSTASSLKNRVEEAHQNRTKVSVVSSPLDVPIDKVPEVESAFFLEPGFGAVILIWIHLPFVPPAPIGASVYFRGEAVSSTLVTPQVVHVKSVKESSSFEPPIPGTYVETVNLYLGSAQEKGSYRVVVNIPYSLKENVSFLFEEELEIPPFQFFVEPCLDEGGLVDVNIYGVSLKAEAVDTTAAVSVNGRSATFPVKSSNGSAGEWEVSVPNFSQATYTRVFFEGDGETSIQMSGETVTQFVPYPPVEELYGCLSEDGGKG